MKLARWALLLALLWPCAAGAAEDSAAPPATNEWTLDCGVAPAGYRFCLLVYIYANPKTPGDFVNFGVLRQKGVEAVFLQPKRGFAANSRVQVRVDTLSARDFAAPPGGKPLSAMQPIDPLAAELARGERAAIFFKPANGRQRSIEVPLSAFGLLLEQARAEVPPGQ
jgi:hypothetical protein